MVTARQARERLGGVLRRYRIAAGLSQEEFARRAGVHRTYVSQVERGVRNPTYESLQKFLSTAKVTWADFGAALDRELSQPRD